jgi:hypothetical protein
MRPLLLRYRPGAQTQQFLNRRARQLQALVMRRSALGAEPVTEVRAAAMRLGRRGLGVAAACDGPRDRHSTCGAFPPKNGRMVADRRITNRASAAGARSAGAPCARSFYATGQGHKRNSSLLGRARQLQALVRQQPSPERATRRSTTQSPAQSPE